MVVSPSTAVGRQCVTGPPRPRREAQRITSQRLSWQYQHAWYREEQRSFDTLRCRWIGTANWYRTWKTSRWSDTLEVRNEARRKRAGPRSKFKNCVSGQSLGFAPVLTGDRTRGMGCSVSTVVGVIACLQQLSSPRNKLISATTFSFLESRAALKSKAVRDRNPASAKSLLIAT